MSGIDTIPTEDGFNTWVFSFMGVPEGVLPGYDNSVDPIVYNTYINYAFEISNETVNLYLNCASPILYTQAVYNLGGDVLVNMAQDDPNLPPPLNTYWTDLRQSLGLNNLFPGIINAANDIDTSAASLIPLGLQNLTLADLQNLKTPWGRQYLMIAQSAGSMWGLTW
jgi:hypothetical protein